MARSNISTNLKALKDNITKTVFELTQEVSEEAGKDVIQQQLSNDFWNNQTFTAVGSIGWNTENYGTEYKMSVGFIAGNPAEQRGSGTREYGQYLAEYKRGIGNTNVHFMGACLNALAKRFREKMDIVSGYKATKATYSKGNWEQTE